MRNLQSILRIFPKELRELLEHCQMDFALLQEIRLRVNQPFLARYDNREYFISRKGLTNRTGEEYFLTDRQLKETMEILSRYSLYAFEEETRQGFLTIQGGHRVGVAGKVTLSDKSIRNMKYISFLNIRVAHERKGCADKILPRLIEKDRLCHTMIISPPGCGKTTLLRDLVRQISDGTPYFHGQTVGLVDERSELAACYLGVPQNDVGIRTDVLDCCPKAEGMIMLIRSMAPRVIAADEVGLPEEIHSLKYAMYCGCSILSTVHGTSIEDIKKRPVLRELLRERLFERYVVLEPGFRVKEIYDGEGLVWE
ncbi:stage III sporulation protein AA [Anaerolentibacter hominis]|uniref:stage III sporulation protein AA n=1 Tax=Anaerolentibacter hominis TaxID=3079009 RepID=UPI0031B7FA48